MEVYISAFGKLNKKCWCPVISNLSGTPKNNTLLSFTWFFMDLHNHKTPFCCEEVKRIYVHDNFSFASNAIFFISFWDFSSSYERLHCLKKMHLPFWRVTTMLILWHILVSLKHSVRYFISAILLYDDIKFQWQ